MVAVETSFLIEIGSDFMMIFKIMLLPGTSSWKLAYLNGDKSYLFGRVVLASKSYMFFKVTIANYGRSHCFFFLFFFFLLSLQQKWSMSFTSKYEKLLVSWRGFRSCFPRNKTTLSVSVRKKDASLFCFMDTSWSFKG